MTAIFNILPEWAVGILLAALLWFGVNYVWIAPAYFESKKIVPDGECNVSHIVLYGSNHKVTMALHTASFGMIDSTRNIVRRICAEENR